MTQPRPFVQDPALTAMAVGYANPDEAMIADRVFPRVPVPGELFKYDYFPPGEDFAVVDDTVGRTGAVPRVYSTGEQRTGKVLDRGLDAVIPYSDIQAAAQARANGDTSFDPEARAIKRIMSNMQINRERRVAAIVSDANNYAAANKVALTGTDKWTDTANSNPLDDMLQGCDATFIHRPNVAAVPRQIWTVLRQHPKMVKAAQGNDGDSGAITTQQLADLLEVDEVLISNGHQNTANRGQAASFSRIWGNAVILFHRAPTLDMEGTPTFGVTPEWRRFGGSAMMAGRIGDPFGGGLEGSYTVRAGEAINEHLIAPELGYLISNPI